MTRLSVVHLLGVVSMVACTGKTTPADTADTGELPVETVETCVQDDDGGYSLQEVPVDTVAETTEPGTYYADSDGDGYGEGDALDCPPAGSVADNSDDAFPEDAAEWSDSDGDGVGDNGDLCSGDDASGDTDSDGVCDDSDDDIDGDALANKDDCDPLDSSVGAAGTWYSDIDGDGLGDAAASTVACDAPKGHVDIAGDDCPDEHGGSALDGCPTVCGTLASSLGSSTSGAESAVFTASDGTTTDLTSAFTDGSFPTWQPSTSGTLTLDEGVYQFDASIATYLDVAIEGAGMGATTWEITTSVGLYGSAVAVRDLSVTGDADPAGQIMFVFGSLDPAPILENVEMYDWNGAAFASFFSTGVVVQASGLYMHDLGYNSKGETTQQNAVIVAYGLDMQDSCLEDASSTARGAIYCQSGGSVAISGSEIRNFEATQTTATRDGSSAINVLQCSLDVSDTLFADNTTGALGGTITAECYAGYDVSLENVTFTDNSSTSSSSPTGTVMLSETGSSPCSSVGLTCAGVSGSGNTPGDGASTSDGTPLTCDSL